MAARPEFEGLKVLVVPDDEAYACNVLAARRVGRRARRLLEDDRAAGGERVPGVAGAGHGICEGRRRGNLPVADLRGAGVMAQRLVEPYPVGDRVEIVFLVEDDEHVAVGRGSRPPASRPSG